MFSYMQAEMYLDKLREIVNYTTVQGERLISVAERKLVEVYKIMVL